MKAGSYDARGLAIELRRRAATAADYIADSRSLRVESAAPSEISGATSVLSILGAGEGGADVSAVVNNHAHGQLASRLGIPKVYYDRMRSENPQLLDANVNSWFDRKPERRLIRTMDGAARAVLSDRYRIIDNLDLIEATLPPILAQPEYDFVSCEITETRMYIKVVLPRIQGEVKVGDPVQAGVVISNSEVGAGAINVQPFLFRLVCLNGMIAEDFGQRRYHLGRAADDEDAAYRFFRDETLQKDDEALFAKVHDTVQAVCDEQVFQQIIDRCKVLADLRPDVPPLEAVERLAKKVTLNDTEKDSVLNHLIGSGDLSGWGYVNAITRTANDVDDYDRATELERLGGKLSEMEPSALVTLLTR
jgi:hypothetical protein